MLKENKGVFVRYSLLILTFLTWLSSVNSVTAQRDSSRLLIYSNKHDYLLPFIEKSLLGLTNVENGAVIFKSVTNLNSLLLNTESDKLLRQNLYYNLPQISISASKATVFDSIVKVYFDHDYFLLINENVLQDKIEFQFTLYEIFRYDTGRVFPIKNVVKSISTANFFVNIDEDTYHGKIEDGLRKVIKTANFSPSCNYKMAGNLVNTGASQFRASINDAVLLSVHEIIDYDTEYEKIETKVKLIESYRSGSKVSLQKLAHHKFNLQFSMTGLYRFVLLISDGIKEITVDTISITIERPPRISLSTDYIESIQYMSFFDRIRSGRDELYIQTEWAIDSLSNKLMVTLKKPELANSESTSEVLEPRFDIKKVKRDRSSWSKSFYAGGKNLLRASYKVDTNLYSIKTYWYNSIEFDTCYVYLSVDSLKSNVEKVLVRRIFLPWVGFNVSAGLTNLQMRNERCNTPDCVEARNESINFVMISGAMDLHIFGGFGGTIGLSVTQELSRSSNTKAILSDLSNYFVDMGVYYSHFFSIKDKFFYLRPSFLSHKTGLGYNPMLGIPKAIYNFGLNSLGLRMGIFSPKKSSNFFLEYRYSFTKQYGFVGFANSVQLVYSFLPY